MSEKVSARVKTSRHRDSGAWGRRLCVTAARVTPQLPLTGGAPEASWLPRRRLARCQAEKGPPGRGAEGDRSRARPRRRPPTGRGVRGREGKTQARGKPLTQVRTVRFLNCCVTAFEIQDYHGNTILIHAAVAFETADLNGHFMRKVVLVCKRQWQGSREPARSASVTETLRVRRWRSNTSIFCRHLLGCSSVQNGVIRALRAYDLHLPLCELKGFKAMILYTYIL